MYANVNISKNCLCFPQYKIMHMNIEVVYELTFAKDLSVAVNLKR